MFFSTSQSGPRALASTIVERRYAYNRSPWTSDFTANDLCATLSSFVGSSVVGEVRN